MIFYSFENLTLIAAVLLAQGIVKRLSKHIFPINKISFIRYVYLKDEKTGEAKNELTKVLAIAQEEQMKENEDYGMYSVILYLLVCIILVYIMKWFMLGFKLLGIKKDFKLLDSEVMKQNLVIYLTILVALLLSWFQLKLMNKINGWRSTETRISFVVVVVLSLPTYLIVNSLSHIFVQDLKAHLIQLNMNLQVITGSFLPLESRNYYFRVSEETFKLLISCILSLMTFFSVPTIIKFSKSFAALQKHSNELDEQIERLQGDPEKNKSDLQIKQGESKKAKKMFIAMLTGLLTKSLMLFFSLKPLVASLNLSDVNHSIFLALLLLADTIATALSVKDEINVKYMTICEALITLNPVNENQRNILKKQTDHIYQDSLRQALISSSRIWTSIILLCLVSGLALKLKTIKEVGLKSSYSLTTELEPSPYIVFKSLSSTCMFGEGISIAGLFPGYGVKSSFSFHEELLKNSFTERINLVSSNATPLLLDTTKMAVYWIALINFFGVTGMTFFFLATGSAQG